jgi:hypothetical protein
MGVVNQFTDKINWIGMKHILCYLKNVVDFGLCFKENIKDVIMGKVHSNEDVNCTQG